MNDPSVLGAGRQRPAVEHQLAVRAAAGITVAVSGLQRQRRAGAAGVPAVPGASTGAACRPARASTTRMEFVLERRFSTGSPGAVRLHLLQAEQQRRGERAGRRRDQRRRAESGRPARLAAQRRRHAARVPDRLHLGGARARRVDAPGREGAAGRLERQRDPPLRERPAAQHHDEQRSRRPAVQRAEAAQSRVRRRRRAPPTATSIRTPTATSTAPPGPIRGRSPFGNAPKRDTTVRSFPIYSEDLNIFKVFPLPNGHKIRFESMFGNIFNRTLFCDPNTNWSAGAFGQVFSQCNSAAIDSVRLEVRLLARRGREPLRGAPSRCQATGVGRAAGTGHPVA